MKRLAVLLILALALPSAAQEQAKTARAKAGKRRAPGLYATFQTSLGNIVCQLYEKETPKTVANFVGLAEGTKEWKSPVTGARKKEPLYNGTIFHRVLPNFMIQGGDPAGNGKGNPGYTFEDEIVSTLTFDRPGRLAMANRGAPNTNGSQFFITEVPTPRLNGEHTIFGQVVEGQAVVTKIGHVARDANNRPLTAVKLEKVTIERVGEKK